MNNLSIDMDDELDCTIVIKDILDNAYNVSLFSKDTSLHLNEGSKPFETTAIDREVTSLYILNNQAAT